MKLPIVSILSCVYNGASELPQAMQCLNALERPNDLPIELLVVDNNSTDDSVSQIQNKFIQNDRTFLRIIHEKRQGAGWATRTGLKACRGEFIAIMDQDNWVRPDWLTAGLAALQADKKLGGVGSLNHAVSKSKIPPWFDRYQSNFAVGPQKMEHAPEALPPVIWSAGCFLRAEAVKQALALDIEPLMVSRAGKSMLAGDDTETFMLMQLCGWRFSYDPRIQIDHFMPEKRLKWRYYLRMREGNGRTAVYVDIYRRILAEILLGKRGQDYQWHHELQKARSALLSDPLGLIAATIPGFEGNNRPALAMSRWGAYWERRDQGVELEKIYNSLRKKVLNKLGD